MDIEFAKALMALDRNMLFEFLEGTIDMYLEYIEVHGHEPESARASAILEMLDGTDAMIELHERGEL